MIIIMKRYVFTVHSGIISHSAGSQQRLKKRTSQKVGTSLASYDFRKTRNQILHGLAFLTVPVLHGQTNPPNWVDWFCMC